MQFGLERRGAKSNDDEDLRGKGEALGAPVSMKLILAPTILHEYFAHRVKRCAVSSGWRETHSAYKTA